MSNKQNFIDYLFNLDSLEEINTSDKTPNKQTNISNQQLEYFIDNTDNILKNWISHTDETKGLHLYMVEQVENNEDDTINQQKWIQGDHGFYLNSSTKIQLNDYLSEKLKELKYDNGCITIDKDNSYQNLQLCNSQLEQIQIKDIHDITNRIDFNSQLYLKTDEYLKKQTDKIDTLNKQIETLKHKLDIQQQKLENDKQNIDKIKTALINFIIVVKKYLSDTPNYREIINTTPVNYQLSKELLDIILNIMNSTNKKNELDDIEKDIIELSNQIQ